MIYSFGNALAEDMFNDLKTKTVLKFPPELFKAARRKLFYLNEAESLNDLRIPPGNRLEQLKGSLTGFHSIRINDQFRIIFKWANNMATEVSVLDYHK